MKGRWLRQRWCEGRSLEHRPDGRVQAPAASEREAHREHVERLVTRVDRTHALFEGPKACPIQRTATWSVRCCIASSAARDRDWHEHRDLALQCLRAVVQEEMDARRGTDSFGIAGASLAERLGWQS
mmetsp:Transcript_103846/g.332831  ORF Transcript_103846/g.332831 Transcript_103846/m.332831 type:complete len:127 (+) Transcript_103846:94-474(+)